MGGSLPGRTLQILLWKSGWAPSLSAAGQMPVRPLSGTPTHLDMDQRSGQLWGKQPPAFCQELCVCTHVRAPDVAQSFLALGVASPART